MKRTTFKDQHMSWFPWPKRLKGNSHTFTITIEDPAMWEYEFKKVREPLPEGEEYWEPAFPDKPETHDHIKMLTTTRDVINPNQLDWNKLIGIKKNLFSPRKNSVMLGWRWNPIDNCLELCPYWHDENGGAHFDYEPFKVTPQQSKRIDLCFIDNKIQVMVWDNIDGHSGKLWSLPDNAYIGTGWMISPWFGGQEKAHKEMTFNIAYSK